MNSTSPWSQVTLADPPALQPSEVRMVLVTGADLLAMQEAALTLFDAGHIPLIAEWMASPMASLPACGATLDAIFEPLSERLLMRADSILRLDGPSASADSLVRLARSQGLRVFFNIEEVLAG
jgi:hypothetical protein